MLMSVSNLFPFAILLTLLLKKVFTTHEKNAQIFIPHHRGVICSYQYHCGFSCL